MDEIQVGLKIYVSRKNHFFHTEPNLCEHVVLKVNNRSFYTCRVEDDSKEKQLTYRFDKKTMQHDDSFTASTWYAYITAEEYWKGIERTKQRVALIEMLRLDLSNFSLEQLIEIEKLMNEMRNERA